MCIPVIGCAALWRVTSVCGHPPRRSLPRPYSLLRAVDRRLRGSGAACEPAESVASGRWAGRAPTLSHISILLSSLPMPCLSPVHSPDRPRPAPDRSAAPKSERKAQRITLSAP